MENFRFSDIFLLEGRMRAKTAVAGLAVVKKT